MHKLINALLFQATWFSAVLVGWALALLPLVAMIVHGLWKEPRQHPYRFLALFALIGISIDTLMFSFGLFGSPNPDVLAVAGMPIWLMCMWVAFSLTLASSLSWWKQWPKLFVLACTLAGPLSYYGGMKLSAITISEAGFVVLVGVWFSAAMVIVFLMPRNEYIPFIRAEKELGKHRAPGERHAMLNAARVQICGTE